MPLDAPVIKTFNGAVLATLDAVTGCDEDGDDEEGDADEEDMVFIPNYNVRDWAYVVIEWAFAVQLLSSRRFANRA